MTQSRAQLRSQQLRLINHQGDALRLGMSWTEEDLGTAVRDFAAHEVVRVLTGKPPLSLVNADQLAARS